MSASMQAAWCERNGHGREVLTIGEMPMPDVGAGEVRVRVRFSGVNPSDTKKRSGARMTFPRVIPHSDGSGVIDAVGAGVDPAGIADVTACLEAGSLRHPVGLSVPLADIAVAHEAMERGDVAGKILVEVV